MVRSQVGEHLASNLLQQAVRTAGRGGGRKGGERGEGGGVRRTGGQGWLHEKEGQEWTGKNGHGVACESWGVARAERVRKEWE